MIAPLGTVTTIWVSLQLVAVADTPLKVTVLEACVAPKFTPETTTDVPTGPEVGDKELIIGAVSTVKDSAFEPTPETVTITFPVEVPAGTGATICESLQLEGLAGTLLKVMVLVPWMAPKDEPVRVTEAPTGPVVGLREVMEGGLVLMMFVVAAEELPARSVA